jgi:adenylate cyclase
MWLLNRIEERVVLPGDSDTRRSQKVLGVVLIFAGSLFTLINITQYLANGFFATAYIYVGWSVFLFLSGLLILALPRYLILISSIVLVVAVVITLAGHIASGGFQAGLQSAIWMLIGPIVAVLLLGPRFSLFIFALFFFCVLLAAWLEPAARSMAPSLPANTRTNIAASNLITFGIMVTAACLYLLRQVETYRQRADELLLNILPGSIAARLKKNPDTIADGYNEVTVLFADIVDFTSMSADADPVEVVNLLNDVFSEFDSLAEKFDLEKIKTIGDAYMVAAGLPEPRSDHTEAIAAFAIEMLQSVEKFEGFNGRPLRLRVGINTGPVVAGVIGRQKFIYDLWGDAVNVASRMESNGLVNQIQVTEAVKDKLSGQFKFEAREPVNIKGKGTMVTYLLVGH